MDVKSLRFVAVALLAVLLISAVTQAFPTGSVKGEESMAKNIVEAASNAEKYVISLVDRVNSTIIELINGSDLKDAFWGNVSLISSGSALLDEAEEDLKAGNYIDAMNEAMEAMGVFKEVWVNIHRILCELGITEVEAEGKPEVQAQGLLVAINRTLERIERIKDMSDDSEFQELLSNATALLNIDEAKDLLAQGDVSDVAHRLAEANHLIAQAYRMLKAKAEERMAERMERFRAKVMERLEAMAGKLNETDLKEIMEEMGFRNMNEFRQALNNLIREAREHFQAGEMGYALGKLRNMDDKFKEFARRFVAKTVPPEARDENPALELSVEKRAFRNQVILSITVNNTGNCDVVFPNAALDLMIEKKVNGEWVPYYRPISAQVLVTLKPGEAREITVKIVKPDEGVYRVTVSGWLKITLKPVTATSTEFNMP